MERSKIIYKKSLLFTKENFWKLALLLFAIPIGFQIVSILLLELISMTNILSIQIIFTTILFVSLYLVQFYAAIALIKFIFNKIENPQYTLNESLRLDKKKILYMVILIILFYAIVTTGLIALIVPGIILALRFSFSFIYLIIRDQKPMDSLVNSYGLIKGKTWIYLKKMIYPIIPIIFLYFIFTVIFLAGTFFATSAGVSLSTISFTIIILLLIGLVFAYFYLKFIAAASVFMVFLFKEFEKEKVGVLPEDNLKREKNFKMMAAIGVILLVIFSILTALV